jgi:hypothetical protein
MSQNFDPISASKTILDYVERYLRSNFNPRRSVIADEYMKAIDDSKKTRDIGGALFREVRRDFAAGRTMNELIEAGVAHPELVQFMKNPPYAHQSHAVELASGAGRNVIIATGTGSGKTEAFLMPILNSLLEERDKGALTPGIRAIVIYPMNALAADQLDRIRVGLTPFPEITFGRFVGPTSDTTEQAVLKKKDGKPFPVNERPSREALIANPPHLLITNYAMLERLMLLPRWAPLFTNQLKWIVMDEVHSYDGAKGIEISMLLRRLKARTSSAEGVQCIAASATLGDPNSPKDAELAATFASNLFGEKFESTDLIRPEYAAEQPPVPLIDVFSLANSNDLEKYRKENFGAYHLFIKNPGGAFICLSESHPKDEPRIRLQQRKHCEFCPALSLMIELGACRTCGIEYLIAKNVREELVPVEEFDEAARYYRLVSADLPEWPLSERLLRDEVIETEESEDSSATVSSNSKWWCQSCSTLSSIAKCPKCTRNLIVEVEEELKVDIKGTLRCSRCNSSGGRSPFGPIIRPVSGVDALTAVISTALYQALPENTESSLPGGERKILAFSDNRQDAAYFAPYLEESYFDLLRRRIIFQALEDLSKTSTRVKEYFLHNLAAAMSGYWKNAGQKESDEFWPFAWIRAELVGTDTNMSLSGTGNVNIFVPKSSMPSAMKYLQAKGLTEESAWMLLNALLESVAYDGAVEVPTGVKANDALFAPREVATRIYLVGDSPSNSSIRWISESTVGNKRSSMILRGLDFAEEKGMKIRPRTNEILTDLWTALNDDRIFVDEKGGFKSIANDSWRIALGANSQRSSWWVLPNGLCVTKNCDGKPIAKTYNPNNHYAYLQREMSILALASKEHTAQWTADEAEVVQDEFIEGKVNVLSCSTTFEMGVDIGEVVAVLCRNVPPTPANYVQRAGRAGRRAGSKALIVTFARKRSHDSQFVADPTRLINGQVPVPTISLENVDLIRRHIYAMALSQFFRDISFLDVSAKALFASEGSTVSVSVAFLDWLDKKPQSLLDQINSLALLKTSYESVGVENWEWADLLKTADKDGRGGWLSGLMELYAEEMEQLKKWRIEVRVDIEAGGTVAQKANRQEGILIRVQNDLERRQMVELLANGGVLPKYGFPVDVASLVPSFASAGSRTDKIELSRDLSFAISEYGPGSSVVAGGNILTSTGLRKPLNATFSSMRWLSLTCNSCGWFTHKRAPSGAPADISTTECQECSTPFRPHVDKRYFLEPRFGFIAKVDPRSAGSKGRPRRAVGARRFVSSSAESDEGWVTLSGNVKISISRSAEVLTMSLNDYLMCETCGYASPMNGSGTNARKHNNPRTEMDCSSQPRSRHYLGHIFKTDVLRIRFKSDTNPTCICGDVTCSGPLESAVAAIVAGATRTLGVASGDLNSGIGERQGSSEKNIMIFDATPGGAGLAKAMADRLPEIIRTAIGIVKNCSDCGKSTETSCYSCIRNYGNQRLHDHLTRGAAELFLQDLNSKF